MKKFITPFHLVPWIILISLLICTLTWGQEKSDGLVPAVSGEISTAGVMGSHINITLRNGEKIRSIKVLNMDSLNLMGVQSLVGEEGQEIEVYMTIPIKDIKRIKIRKFSPLATSGLAVAMFFPIVWQGDPGRNPWR